MLQAVCHLDVKAQCAPKIAGLWGSLNLCGCGLHQKQSCRLPMFDHQVI